MALIIERTEAPGWTSNSYLVADPESGHAVVIDGNGVVQGNIDRAKELGVTVDAILVTHQHADHVEAIVDYRDAFGAPVPSRTCPSSRIDGTGDGRAPRSCSASSTPSSRVPSAAACRASSSPPR